MIRRYVRWFLRAPRCRRPNIWDTTARVPPFSCVDLAREDVAEMSRLDREAVLPVAACNRNRSRPMVLFHFRAGNCVANARSLRLANRSILPRMGVLPPAADHRNKSQPKSRPPHRAHALAACCARIHRPRSSRGRGFAGQSRG